MQSFLLLRKIEGFRCRRPAISPLVRRRIGGSMAAVPDSAAAGCGPASTHIRTNAVSEVGVAGTKAPACRSRAVGPKKSLQAPSLNEGFEL